MCSFAVEAAADCLLKDDVAGLRAHIDSERIDIHAVYEGPEDPEEDWFIYYVSVLTVAIHFNALKCVAWLRENKVDMSKRVFVNPVCFRNYRGEKDDGEDNIRVWDVAYTPLQLATVLHGRRSEMAELLRAPARAHARLRKGFNSMYFLCFRKSFAPGEKAAERARLAFEAEAFHA